MFKHDPAKLVAEFCGPVLVVSGSTDIQVSAADAKRLGGGEREGEGRHHRRDEPRPEGGRGHASRCCSLPSYSDPTLPLHPKLVPELAAFLKRIAWRKVSRFAPRLESVVMAKKEVKPFLLRIDPRVLAAVQRWAEADLRSLNGQIEFILRQALAKRGVKLAEEPPSAEAPAKGD